MREHRPVIHVRPLDDADQSWKASTLESGWGSTKVARMGELIDAAMLPGFVAEHDGQRVGLATYAERFDGVEVVTIQALLEERGVGRALMERLWLLTVESGAVRLWLTTTNDNVRALSFFQRWGMDFVRFIHEGVADSRRVKPSIPIVGASGIPLRHELQLELRNPSSAVK